MYLLYIYKLLKRFNYILGDVSLIQFGMSDDDYGAICYDIDYVIHAAAQVNLSYPFRALYKNNVIGTKNIIQFCMDGKIKPLYHIRLVKILSIKSILLLLLLFLI